MALRAIMRDGPIFNHDRTNRLRLNVKYHQNHSRKNMTFLPNFDRNNKENVRSEYTHSMDRSVTSSAYRGYRSMERPPRNQSNSPNGFHRKKRRAPQPPNASQQMDNYSLDQSDKPTLFRKKRPAPVPPQPKRGVRFPSFLDSPRESKEIEMPPIPPEDYDVDEPDEVFIIPPPPTFPPPDLPVRPPTPPPLPERAPTPPPPPVEEVATPKPTAKPPIPSKPSFDDLRQEIMIAAAERAKKPTAPIVIIPSVRRHKSLHEVFRDELTEVCQDRESRRAKGSIRLINQSKQSFYKALENEGENSKPQTIVEKDEVQEDKSETKDEVKEDTISNNAWTPADDLGENDLGDVELISCKEITSPSVDMPQSFSMFSPKFGNEEEATPKFIKNKKSKKKSKKNTSEQYGSVRKFKKSVRTALGSIGRGFSRRKQLNEIFDKGWDILPAEDYDPAPDGPIRIASIEKRPAYAYNSENGQLMLLPDYDRILVTKEGKRIREESITKVKTINEMEPIPSPKLSEAKISGGMTEWEKIVQEERDKQTLAEMQFQQVRKLSKQSDPGSLAYGASYRQKILARRKHISSEIYASSSDDADGETSSCESSVKGERLGDSGFGTDNSNPKQPPFAVPFNLGYTYPSNVPMYHGQPLYQPVILNPGYVPMVAGSHPPPPAAPAPAPAPQESHQAPPQVIITPDSPPLTSAPQSPSLPATTPPPPPEIPPESKPSSEGLNEDGTLTRERQQALINAPAGFRPVKFVPPTKKTDQSSNGEQAPIVPPWKSTTKEEETKATDNNENNNEGNQENLNSSTESPEEPVTDVQS